MTKTVRFYNEEDEKVLVKKVIGETIQEIERKCHNLLEEAGEVGHKYYKLYLQSFSLNR